MKKLSRLKYYLFVFSMLFSAMHTYASTTSNIDDNTKKIDQTETIQDDKSTADTQAQEKVSNETIEEIRKLILNMLTEVDFALETIVMYITADDIEVDDKDATIDNIKTLRQLIHFTSRDVMMYADMTTLTRSLKIVTAFQEHIQEAVNIGLKKFPKFNIDLLQLKSVTELGPNEIKEEIKVLKEDLDYIKQDTEKAGITLINHIYRNTADPIIETIDRYGLHTKTAKALGLALIVAYFTWRFSQDTYGCVDKDGNPFEFRSRLGALGTAESLPSDPTFFQKSRALWNNFVMNYIGRYHYSTLDAENIDEKYRSMPTGLLGRFESILVQLERRELAIGAFFLPTLTKYYNENIIPSVDWVKKKFYGGHCWLKGGIYHKNNKNRSDKPLSLQPRFKLKDIIGYSDAKKVCYDIIEYINDPEKFQRLGIIPPKGILLHGPPGSGKSYLVEAFCGDLKDALKKNNRDESEFEFFNIKSTHIQQMGLDNILGLIKRCAPCVVFIDEIDLLSLQRDRNPERLAEFLTGLSGYLSEDDPKKQVIIIGATNKLENVDRAITRTGRLSKLIYLDYPTFENRYEFLLRALDDRINPDLFDLEVIARQTDDCTMEDLRTIINTALFKTRITCQPLSQQHLEDALNSEVRKIAIQQELDLPEAEQRILATHMAGHAVAQMLLSTQRVLSTVTIKPITELTKEKAVWHQFYKEKDPGQVYGRMFTYRPHDSIGGNGNTETMLNECKILLAGRIAEKLLLGSISSNNNRSCSGTCKPSAFNVAKSILLEGLEEDQLSKPMKEEISTNARKLLQELEQEVTTLFEEQKHLIILAMEMLMQYKTISQDDILHTLEAYQKILEEKAKNDPDFMKKLEEEMKSMKQKENEDTKQAIENELGITEEVPAGA